VKRLERSRSGKFDRILNEEMLLNYYSRLMILRQAAAKNATKPPKRKKQLPVAEKSRLPASGS
jgi:hypothetical protein